MQRVFENRQIEISLNLSLEKKYRLAGAARRSVNSECDCGKDKHIFICSITGHQTATVFRCPDGELTKEVN